jgi:hypothetical protein
MSGNALAKAAGVDPGQVNRLLDGRRDLRVETFKRILDALGLRVVEVAQPRRRRGAVN